MVDHRSGPLLVLAGPGTGKTTTLVESVADRIARGGDPERILVLTFSRKAAVELRDRMALRIGAARAPRATTFTRSATPWSAPTRTATCSWSRCACCPARSRT